MPKIPQRLNLDVSCFARFGASHLQVRTVRFLWVLQDDQPDSDKKWLEEFIKAYVRPINHIPSGNLT
jgi:hypothetical protein